MTTGVLKRLEIDILEHTDIRQPSVVRALNVLFGQLNPDDRVDFSASELIGLATTPQQHTYVAKLDRKIVAMTTLYVLYTPKGRKGKIDYVATHPDYLHQGIASTLVRWVLATAKKQGCYRAELTSNPDRRAEANAMYLKLGFTIHDTNVFFYDLAGL